MRLNPTHNRRHRRQKTLAYNLKLAPVCPRIFTRNASKYTIA